MKSLHKLTVFAAAAVVGATMTFGASAAYAADLPCRTARVIVPWGAGGESDLLGRMAVDAANRLGAKPQLQIVTIGGQGGIKGSQQAAEAKPDGCTLFNIHQHILASNLTGRTKLNWDSYIPVANLTSTASIIAAGTDAPFSNYKEMQKFGKDNPNTILAGGTLGSTSHFSLLQVADKLGIQMKYISYDGTADRMKALLANTIHIGQVSEVTGAKHAEAGRLKLLAMNYHQRSTRVPDLPTAQEQGFDIVIATDRGFMLPKGTPQEVVDHYIDLFKKVAADKQYVETVTRQGSFVVPRFGDDYAKWWDATYKDWVRIAKNLGVYKGS